jgi:hypothetical protein
MKTLLATLLLALPLPALAAELLTYGPTPYARLEDSPFYPWRLGTFPLEQETFEDGTMTSSMRASHHTIR